MNIASKILSDITVHMKYARFLPEESRRETWDELVDRNLNMHIKKFPALEEEIRLRIGKAKESITVNAVYAVRWKAD